MYLISSLQLITGSLMLPYICLEWNLIRLGGPAHGIVTKTVHKTLPGGGGVKGSKGGRGSGEPGVVGRSGLMPV